MMGELENQDEIFELDDETESPLQIEPKDGPMYSVLRPNSSFIFVDSGNKQIWIWHGRHTGIRKKILATQIAPDIRDRYGIDYKITTVDDGNEDLVFKVFLGLD